MYSVNFNPCTPCWFQCWKCNLFFSLFLNNRWEPFGQIANYKILFLIYDWVNRLVLKLQASLKMTYHFFENTHNMKQHKEMRPVSSGGRRKCLTMQECQCQQCSVTLPALINLPFSHSHLIKNNYLYCRGPSPPGFFIPHYNPLSHVDWHAGFISFIALLTCYMLYFSISPHPCDPCLPYRAPRPL